MTARSARAYERTFGGNPPCRVVEIHADDLTAHRLLAPSRVRARDAAHLFARQYHPSVEAVALPPHAVRSSSAPERLQRHGSDAYLSLRAALSAWWARTTAAERAALLAPGAGELARFISAIKRRGLVATHRHPADADAAATLVRVGSLGYLRQIGRFLPESLLLNTHFFVFDPSELDDPLAALGDPVGMLATRGQIRHPPSVPRATLTHAGGRWSVGHLGANDLEIDFPDGTTVRPGTSDAATLAYRGRAPEDGEAPPAEPAVEVCLQGRYATVVRSGGTLGVPHGALVVSFAADPGADLLRALQARPFVRYRVPRIPDLATALQAGPQLVRGGEVVVDDVSLRQERFGVALGAAPLVFSTDHASTRAGRVGIGVTRTNGLVLIAVQGASSLSADDPNRPNGCTMVELAETLVQAGAVDALNCDGGGSTQVFHGAGALVSSTDSRAVRGGQFDRPVPVAACVG